MKGIIISTLICMLPFLLFSQNDYLSASSTVVYEIRVEDEQIFKDSDLFVNIGPLKGGAVDCKELGLSFLITFRNKKGSSVRVKGMFETDSLNTISFKEINWYNWQQDKWGKMKSEDIIEGEFFEHNSEFLYFKIEPGLLEHNVRNPQTSKTKARFEFTYEYLDY